MANEPSWDEIFGGTQTPRPSRAAAPVEAVSSEFPTARLSDPFAVAAAEATATMSIPIQNAAGTDGTPSSTEPPLTRRDTLRAESGRRPSRAKRGAPPSDGGSGGRAGDTGRKRRRWIPWVAILAVILAAVVGVGWYGWTNYEKQIRSIMGWELSNDYEGAGNGTEVVVVIRAGDIGSDVAKNLEAAGVTMSYDAVYDYLVKHPDISFLPGNFRLQKQMSAKSAIAALQDPENRIISKVTIPEGMAARDALPILAAALELPVAEVKAAAADYTSFGIPANPANSIEGYLFPARYDFEPGTSAHDALQLMVDETFRRLDKAGVAPEDRYRVLTLASVVQRESGPSVTDMHKIARVFQNRIDIGMRLQSDATVAYGTGNTHTVWTTKAERADASNRYNTYANDGLPVGPIGLPGDDAIDSALHPADGSWLYFVPINLKTGETVFSDTAAQHQAAVDQLDAWCRASAENKTYCA